MKRLRLCADDYAMGPAIDRGMLALAQQQRVGALSCLSSSPRWPAAAGALRDLPSSTALGLHFNLTEGEPSSVALRRRWPRFPSLGRLLAMAAAGQLPQAEISEEWQTQLDRFIAARGRAPQFIDGHQHVHALPGVRDALLRTARSLGLPMRDTGHILGPGHALKRFVIESCGGRALRRAMIRQGIAHASALLGVYDFDPAADYRALMRGWLARLPDAALLFCHPAIGGPDEGDSIGVARHREAAYLGGSAFADDLEEFGVILR